MPNWEPALHPEPDHDAPDMQHVLEQTRAEAKAQPRSYECPKCLGNHEVPGICWRCRL